MGEDGDLQFGGPISSSPTDRPWDPHRLTSQHREPLLLPRPGCSTDLTSCRVTPVRHVRLQRMTGSIWPLSLGIWRHVSRSTTPRCDVLIGGKGVTLASRRATQRDLGPSRSRAWTHQTCIIKPTSEENCRVDFVAITLNCTSNSLPLKPVAVAR